MAGSEGWMVMGAVLGLGCLWCRDGTAFGGDWRRNGPRDAVSEVIRIHDSE